MMQLSAISIIAISFDWKTVSIQKSCEIVANIYINFFQRFNLLKNLGFTYIKGSIFSQWNFFVGISVKNIM